MDKIVWKDPLRKTIIMTLPLIAVVCALLTAPPPRASYEQGRQGTQVAQVVRPPVVAPPKPRPVLVVKPKPKPKPKLKPKPKPKKVIVRPRPLGGVWHRLRHLESGDRYNINTGNGYYGAYQFALRTWRGLGYKGYPHRAPYWVQDRAAQQLQRKYGWRPWLTSARRMGLIRSYQRSVVRRVASNAVRYQGRGPVAFAYAQLGRPYRSGGIGLRSYDCSGLAYRAYAKRIPRNAHTQYVRLRPVRGSLRPGDLIFRVRNGHAYHVGIYIGGGRVIEAKKPGTRVMISKAWRGPARRP